MHQLLILSTDTLEGNQCMMTVLTNQLFLALAGVPLLDGGTVRLPALIGLSRAMDMILTGRAVGAEEARLMGMQVREVWLATLFW